MLTLNEILKFCKSKSNKSYEDDLFCVCCKPIGPFVIGDYVIRTDSEKSGFLYKGFGKECYLAGEALKNFEYIRTTMCYFNQIELLVPVKHLFGNKTKNKKQPVCMPELYCSNIINSFYDCFIVLPLQLVYALDSDLLLPFSYLITQVLENIKEFDKSYIDPTKENEYIKFLYSCFQTIDEIKENCLSMYFNGIKAEDSLINAANKRFQLLNEANQLKSITTTFFKDFNSDFINSQK